VDVTDAETGSLLPDDIMERIVEYLLDVDGLRNYHQVNREGREMVRNRMDAFDEQVIQPLIRASRERQPHLVFIQDQNRRGINRPLTTTGLSGLHLAYQLNDFDALEDLRKMSADPNVRIRYGYTVLFLAARDGNLEMIEYFLRDWNADYNIGDSLDKTPLGLAFELVNQDMAELFIRYGAELSPNILEHDCTSFDLCVLPGNGSRA
jgi:ankyrin repeat protein